MLGGMLFLYTVTKIPNKTGGDEFSAQNKS